MKIVLTVLIVLSAAAAFGQNGAVLQSQPYPVVIPDHPAHASQQSMASENYLVGGGGFSYAQGERPLWEFGPMTEPVPLGDVARAVRKEKENAKKAAIIYEKQGS